jgi:hypothetical protein
LDFWNKSVQFIPLNRKAGKRYIGLDHSALPFPSAGATGEQA